MKEIVHLMGLKPFICRALNCTFKFKKLNTLFNRHAFSLVEMLMALLVASLLLAALAPVMTRRMNESLNVTTTGSIIPTIYCAYVNNDTSTQLYEDMASGCLVPTNIYSFDVVMASGGGGGGAAADGVESSQITENIRGTAGAAVSDMHYATKNITIDRFVKDIEIELLGSGGVGGKGNYELQQKIVPSDTNCSNYSMGKTDTVGNTATSTNDILVYDSLNKLCVTKHNQGDGHTNYNCYAGYEHNACSGTGCQRIVCGQPSGTTACRNFRNTMGSNDLWRLVTKNQMEKWPSQLNKLNICVSAVYTGVEYCSRGVSNSLDGQGSAAWPGSYWTSTVGPSGGVSRYNCGLSNTEIGCSPGSGPGRLFSIRCTWDGKTFVPYIGGGGGSGMYIKKAIPNDVLEKAFENYDGTLNLRLLAGHGAKAKDKGGATTGRAVGSYAELYKGNTLIWKVGVPHSYSGEDAPNSRHGVRGSGRQDTNEDDWCSYMNIYDENYKTDTYRNCALIGAMGGENGKNGDEGGSGGAGYWEGKRGIAALGGVAGRLDGQDGNLGGGGAGGTCVWNFADDKWQAECGEGGAGGPGAARVTFKREYPGAGGGGGGAGIAARIRKIQARPGDLIKVQIGEGGEGGATSGDTNGKNGGDTAIILTRNNLKVAEYKLIGGGGGEGATGGNLSTLAGPVAGKGGVASKLANGTKISKEDYFPENVSDTKGYDAPAYGKEKSAGGNGGVNSKTSPLIATDGELNGKPCGGFNIESIAVDKNTFFECTNNSSNPLPLTRSLYKESLNDNDVFRFLSTFAPGATGGGGGGWLKNQGASNGAKGLGGYVFIYFGDWSGE